MLVLVLLIIALVLFGAGFLLVANITGYDDGLMHDYSNTYRGIRADMYDAGYNSSSGNYDRKMENMKRNQERYFKKEVKVND